MKILLGIFLLLVFTFNSFGSPLIFKKTIDKKDEGFTEIANFDATNYKHIRIRIKTDSTDENRTTEIHALESDGEVLIERDKFSYVIEIPPSKISIRANGKGKYTVYIWGQ